MDFIEPNTQLFCANQSFFWKYYKPKDFHIFHLLKNGENEKFSKLIITNEIA